MPNVLVRLATTASRPGRMLHQSGDTAQIYVQLTDVLEQLNRLEEVIRSV